MVNKQEIRIGNWLFDTVRDRQFQVFEVHHNGVMIRHYLGISFEQTKEIPLTPEILEQCGLVKDTIDNPFFSGYAIQIGRGREISVSNPGTPNEFVFLTELNDDKTRNVIVLRNYDYDGKTYLHHLQNIHHSFTGEELVYQPIKELT